MATTAGLGGAQDRDGWLSTDDGRASATASESDMRQNGREAICCLSGLTASQGQ